MYLCDDAIVGICVMGLLFCDGISQLLMFLAVLINLTFNPEGLYVTVAMTLMRVLVYSCYSVSVS